MDNWQEDWVKKIATAANGIEQFLQEMGQEIGDVTQTLMDMTDEMAEEMGQAIAPTLDQIDQHLSGWLTPFVELEAELNAFFRDMDDPEWENLYSEFSSPPGEPLINQHPICRGCLHYHGQVYNGTPLVCAMHPYGIVDGAESCVDKEVSAGQLPASQSSEISEDDF